MLSCDYFIYTSAKTEKREGYQIISKTDGITEKIIDELTDYFYPVGVDPLEFNESRSLRAIADDKIVYSVIKNIGTGYDTRKGTLYNQSFVINKNDFQIINNDSRIFDDFFEINLRPHEVLEKINIEPRKIPFRFEKIRDVPKEALSLVLKYLILGRNLALSYTSDPTLIQDILAILPPSMRIIPFSTLVNQPKRQPEFNFIQIPKKLFYTLDRTWESIDITNPVEIPKLGKNDSDFEYLTEIISSENHKVLDDIHRSFESLPSNDHINKIRFVIHKTILSSTLDAAKKAEEAFFCSTMAQNFDQWLASKYLSDAKKYSLESKNESLLQQIEIGEFALKIQKEPISISLIEEILKHVTVDEPELRSIFLNKIIKKKKNELEIHGGQLLDDVISSNSPYKEDILRLYVENKFLHNYLTQFISSLQKKKKGTHPLLKILVKISIHHNFRFLKKLAKTIKIELNESVELNLLRYLIDDICSNQEIQNKISVNIAISISSSLRLKINKALEKQTTKENQELKWISELNFSTIESDLIQILLSVKRLLDIISSRASITEKEEYRTKNEIEQIDTTINLIKSIKYKRLISETPTIPNFMDLFFTFWGFKK